MVKYVLRRRQELYVRAPHTFVRGTWTRNVWLAQMFANKRDASRYLGAADIRKEECEIVSIAWVDSDAIMDLVSKRAELRFLLVHDPRSRTSTNTGPTDQGLASVGRMTYLEEMDVYASGITDKGLLHLRTLTGLRTLKLKGTQVTDEGVERLREVLADCNITRLTRPRWQWSFIS